MTSALAYSPRIPVRQYPLSPDFEMRARIALGRGIFERESFETFMQYVPCRDTAVEVGAHVGSWTIGLSKLFNHVVCFEPQPVNREFLEGNLKRAHAGNVTVHPLAVSTKGGFSISASNTTRNSGMAHLVPQCEAPSNAIPVDCVRLDDILNHTLKPDVRIGAIKVDVEGMELDVLRSGEFTIATHRPTILLEINSLCERYGFSNQEVLDYMAALNYRNVACTRYDHVFVPA